MTLQYNGVEYTTTLLDYNHTHAGPHNERSTSSSKNFLLMVVLIPVMVPVCLLVIITVVILACKVSCQTLHNNNINDNNNNNVHSHYSASDFSALE